MARPHIHVPRLTAILALACAVIAVDQLTKWWAESTLRPGATTPVVGEYLQWHLIYNPGAAFGLAAQYTWILTAIAGVAVLALLAMATRIRTLPALLATGILLGGATSHFADRLLRTPGFARGHIVDFIDYNGFFIGNVADIAKVLGVTALALLNILRLESPAPAPVDPTT